MPSTRIVLALNTQQTNKAIILLPNPPPADLKAHIFTTAKQKLRCKKPARIFLIGGYELSDNASLGAHIGTDTIFLISSGEDYVGNVSSFPAVAPTANVLSTVICDPEDVDPLALTQLENCRSLPGMVHVVGLPDLHPGDQFPVGGSFACDGYVHPMLIGGDIGCGMSLYRTLLNADRLDSGNGWKRVAECLTGLEGPWLDARARTLWAGDSTAGETWDACLGTIGKGNHFAEIQVIEETFHFDEYQNPLEKGEVVLLVHSGSRGYGKDILSRQKKLSQKGAPGSSLFFASNSPEASTYLELHDRACGWAALNRDLIALRFFQKIEQSDEWTLSDSCESGTEESSNRISELKERLSSRRYLSVFHNAVIPTYYPLLDRSVFIHRKGAAPAAHGATFLPIPGSRGTRTLFVQPLFTPSNSFGHDNLYSIAHGAGRRLTRTKALRTLKDKYANSIETLNANSPAEARSRPKDKVGANRNGPPSVVICEDPELVWEEAPEAYKEIETVGKELEKRGIVKIIGWSMPRISYKVRREFN